MKTFGIRISLFIIFLSSFLRLTSQNCNPIVKSCADTSCGKLKLTLKTDGNNVFCQGTKVTLEIDRSQTSTLDSIFIYWCDGTVDYYGGNTFIFEHTFNVPEDKVCEDKTTDFDVKIIGKKYCSNKFSCATITYTVKLNNEPRAKFDYTAVVCKGKQVNFFDMSCNVDNNQTDAYLWTFHDGTTSTLKNPSKIYNAPGTYKVTLKVKNSCGEHEISHDIIVVDFPNTIVDISSNALDSVVCIGDIVTLINKSNSYSNTQWLFQPNYNFLRDTMDWRIIDEYITRDTHSIGIKDSIPFLDTIAIVFKKAGTYTFRMQSMNVCTTLTWTYTIRVEDRPRYTPLVNPSPFCDSATYNPWINIISGRITGYEWEFPGGVPNKSNQANPGFIKYSMPGNYSIKVKLNSDCDTILDSIEIVINSRMPVNINKLKRIYCKGDGVDTLEADRNGGQWSGTGIINGKIGSFDPKNLIPGNSIITYTIGPPGCTSTDTFLIQIMDGPVISSQDIYLCKDSPPIQLIATPGSGSWSGSPAIDSNGLFDPGKVAVGVTKVNYNVKNSNGCESNKTINVTVEPIINITIRDTVDECIGLGVTDLSTLLNATSNQMNGVFSFEINGQPVSNPVDFSNYAAGEYSVKVIYKKNNCEASTIGVIRFLPKQILSISSDTTICINQNSLQLISSLSGGSWEGPGIDPKTGIIDLMKGVSGIYKYTYLKGKSCELIDSVKITILNPGIGLDAGKDEIICDGASPKYILPMPSPPNGKWSGIGIDPITGEIDLSLLRRDSSYTFSYCLYNGTVDSCEACDTKTLMIKSLPIASFDVKGLACINEKIEIVDRTNGPHSLKFDLGDNTTSNLDSFIHVYSSKATYTISLMVRDNFGCPGFIQKSFYVTTKPNSSFITLDKDGCAPFLVNTTNTSQGDSLRFLWRVNKDSFNVINLNNIILDKITKDSTFIIQLEASNLCGTIISIDSVLVHPYPIVSLGVSNYNGCSPLKVDFINNTLGNPRNYNWDLGNGVNSTDSIPISQIYSVINDSITKYKIRLIASNACGIDTAEKEITVYPPDVKAAIEGPGLPLCQFDSLRLFARSTHGSINTWKIIAPNGNNIGASGDSIIIPLELPGLYSIILFASRCGSDSDTFYLNSLEAPTLDFNLPSTGCLGDTIFFTNKSKDVAGSIWDFGDGTNLTITNGYHVYSQVGTFTVRLTAYSIINNCPFSIEKKINILGKPISSISSDKTQGCEPLSIMLSNNRQVGINYSWDFGDGIVNSNDTIIYHTYNMDGNYQIILRAYDNFGCFSDTAIQNIIVYPKPTSNFEYLDTLYCHRYDSIHLINYSQGDVSSMWTVENNSFNNRNLNYLPRDTGLINITLISTSTYGCSDTIIKSSYISPSPTSKFTLDKKNGCIDLKINFTNNSTSADRFIWDFGNGNTSIDKEPIYTYKSGGLFKVSLIAINSNGCPSDTIENEIHAYPLPIASFNLLKDSICGIPMNVLFINQSTGNLNNEWIVNNQAYSQNVNDSIVFRNEGKQDISLIVKNEFGCMDALEKQIEIFPKPLAAFLVENKLCEGDLIMLSNLSSGALKYKWIIDGLGELSEFEPKIKFEKQGIYSIKLIAEYNSLCLDSTFSINSIQIFEKPKADFDYTASFDDNIIGEVKFNNKSINFDRILWNLGNGNTSNEVNPLVEYDINRNINVTLYAYNDNNGLFKCFDTINKSIAPEWITTFYAPNVLSPELGDGLLKVFKPVGIGIEKYQISIYSPWGEVVWSSDKILNHSPEEAWDGTYKGVIVPQGSYSWMADVTFVNGARKIYKGSVTVLR